MNAEQLLNFAIKIERENALKSERTSTKIIQEFRSYWLKKEKIVIPFFQDFSCLYANLKEEKQKRKLLELANKHRTHYSPFIANSIQGTLRPIQDKNYYYDSSVYKEEPGILDIIENNGIYSFLTEFGNIEVLKASEYFKNSNLSTIFQKELFCQCFQRSFEILTMVPHLKIVLAYRPFEFNYGYYHAYLEAENGIIDPALNAVFLDKALITKVLEDENILKFSITELYEKMLKLKKQIQGIEYYNPLDIISSYELIRKK